MTKRPYPPFAGKMKRSKWQHNHVFVITGPGAYELAQSLYERGQCQPAIPCPEHFSPELYRWPVSGKDVTVKNLGTTDEFAERLVYELLKAGPNLVVNADDLTGAITIYRREGLSNVA